MVNRYVVVPLAWVVTAGCGAHMVRIEPAAPGAPNPTSEREPLHGIVFTLPKTALDVSLSVNTVQKMPGKYCEFNDLFWPGHEACDKDFKPAEKRERSKPEISLTSMVVATHGIPDVDKRFVLPITSKVTVDSSDSIDLTESGSVTGAESTQTDRTGELVLGAVNTIASIAGKAIGGAKAPKIQLSADFSKFIDELAGHLGDPEDQHRLKRNFSQLDAKRQAAYTTLKDGDERYQELLRALQVWEDIQVLIQRRDAILTGTGSNLGTGITDLLAANNSLLDKAVGESFVGTTRTVTWNPTFEIIPDRKTPGNWSPENIELFSKNGVKGCFLSVSSTLIKNSLTKECGSQDAAEPVRLKLEAADTTQLASVIGGFYSKPEQTSYPFNIPANVRVSVTGLGSVPPQTVMLAQWGALNFLPVGKPAKGKTLKVTYYEATGALKSVKFSSDAPLNKAVIDSLSVSAGAVQTGQLKADADEQKKQAAAADELAKLTRHRQILEEQDKIAKLCAHLGITCGK
ncbi:MAG: DUF4831 family protein [Acidobacteriota bacterium]|nr:DUF4831 family protein [Acidobacteriota bacterium]